MKNKINPKQYLRYAKTFAWAMHNDQITISESVLKKSMDNYPVDCRDLRDAITCIEAGEGLRSTSVSMTDLFAIKEALQHKQNDTANSTADVPGSTEHEDEHGPGTSEADSPVLDKPSKKRATRSRKGSKGESE
jgi:hypothetical protein